MVERKGVKYSGIGLEGIRTESNSLMVYDRMDIGEQSDI